jgi:hypothetical protein
MERNLNPLRFALAAVIALGVLLGASIMLPHDRYYRFQAYDNVTTRKADWIYERLHFDPTPIDVALIGTSRTGGGLSAPLIERAYCKATGRRIRVANLGLPETGRNMHYLLAREAAKTKAPALTIVELNDVETRKPHSGFVFLADARDVLTAPAAINLNYLSDLIRLPGRQAALFAQTIFGQPALRKTFDPQAYAGAHMDRTTVQIAIDGGVKSRDVVRSRDDMNALRARRMQNVSPTWLAPEPLRFLEYRFSKAYLNRIEHAANDVAYVYLPAYGEPAPAQQLLTALEIDERIIDLGGAAALDPSLWLDATHFNAEGARDASLRLADALARAHPTLGAAQVCE